MDYKIQKHIPVPNGAVSTKGKRGRKALFEGIAPEFMAISNSILLRRFPTGTVVPAKEVYKMKRSIVKILAAKNLDINNYHIGFRKDGKVEYRIWRIS